MMRNGMRPIHPGEVLREEYLAPLNLSGNALAKSLRVPANRVNGILNGSRAVSADTALRLSCYFRTTPEFWMNLQKAYELRVADRAAGAKIRRQIKPAA